jgi:hypothetical protein
MYEDERFRRKDLETEQQRLHGIITDLTNDSREKHAEVERLKKVEQLLLTQRNDEGARLFKAETRIDRTLKALDTAIADMPGIYLLQNLRKMLKGEDR